MLFPKPAYRISRGKRGVQLAPQFSLDGFRAGLAAGKMLIQTEVASRQAVLWIEELLTRGEAVASPWYRHLPTNQYRRAITGVKFNLPPLEDLIKCL